MSAHIRKNVNRTEEVNKSSNQTQSQKQRQAKEKPSKSQSQMTDYKHNTQYKQYMVRHGIV